MRINEIYMSTGNTMKNITQQDVDDLIYDIQEWELAKKFGNYTLYVSTERDNEVVFAVNDGTREYPDLGVATFKQEAKKHAYTSNIFFTKALRRKGLAYYIYKHFIENYGDVISDSSQTKGSKMIWEKLAADPSVHVYAWNPDTDKAFSWDPEEEDETHVYNTYDDESVVNDWKKQEIEKIKADMHAGTITPVVAMQRLEIVKQQATARKRKYGVSHIRLVATRK